MRALSDDAAAGQDGEFRQRLDNGETLDDLLIEAFAVVREAADRVIGQRHFDVQLMGGAALHFGWVAEMKTGEGKTLVSTLPAYLNGLSGKGVHLVTVNDYLARFHAEWMGRIHRWLGLEVGLVIPGFQEHAEPRSGPDYACDITYGTNNEFGFDYLRDNMATSLADKVQRGHNYAIVDEVDSILIDEARTPLIISGRVADAAKLYYQFASIVRSLKRDDDYEVDEEKRSVVPLETGIERVEQALGLENLYDEVQQNLVHQLSGRAEGQGALQAGQGLHHPGRRGEDRRRVHRPHPRGPPLERGHPPGGRGQGGGEDQGGEPDPRHDHPPELLPHVRQARRHDRHGLHRGGRADEHLRARRSCRSRPTSRWSATTGRPDLQVRGRQVRRRRRRPRRALRERASRCSSAPSPWRRASTCRAQLHEAGHPPRGAQRQAAHAGGGDRRPGRAARRRHRRHQHGRSWRRHHPRRQPRGPGPPGGRSGRASRRTCWSTSSTCRRRSTRCPRSTRRSRRRPWPATTSCSSSSPTSAGPRATRCASSAASTCSAPSATRAAASTTSSAAAPGVRATRARAASTSASTTS